MIKTRHTVWADKIFRIYIHRLIRKYFNAIYRQGEIPVIEENKPLLLLPNHSTWWDGFLIYWINETFFRRPLYLMMLEEQLRKYPFFSRIGAYSINPGRIKDVKESLDYTIDILEREEIPSPLVCIYPQGELKTACVRPLGIKTGYNWIIQNSRQDIQVLPLAIRMEFTDQQRPEIFFRFDEIFQSNEELNPSPVALDHILSSLLDQIEESLDRKEKGYLYWTGSKSVSEKWDNIKSYLGGRKGK